MSDLKQATVVTDGTTLTGNEVMAGAPAAVAAAMLLYRLTALATWILQKAGIAVIIGPANGGDEHQLELKSTQGAFSGGLRFSNTAGSDKGVLNFAPGYGDIWYRYWNGSAWAELFRIKGNGCVGIGIEPASNTKLDINGSKMRLRSAQTIGLATAAGNQGDICWDANYVYVCVAANTWKRAALATW